MISKNDVIPDVEQLIDLGSEKGFLTQEEINSFFPADLDSSENINDLMIMLGEMGIDIVDKLENSQANRSKINFFQEDEENEKSDKIDYAKVSDPSRMYLNEMGSVSLLTCEEEVQIAKQIEEGKKKIKEVVLNAPVTIREVREIGKKLSTGSLSIGRLSGMWKMTK